jgi:hypothetical protein
MRRSSLLVLPGYILVAVVALWPVVTRFGSAIPASHGPFDPPFQAFLLGWDWHALTTAPLRIFDAPIFHPEPRTLTYMDHMIGETLLASPLFAAGGSLAAGYNLVLFASYVLSAWGAYRLTRLFGASRPGSFLAGMLFILRPYRWANLDLLNQLQTQSLPWGLYFAIRYVRQRRPRDAAVALAILAAQVYFGWYYACILLIGLMVVVAHALFERTGGIPRGQWKALAVSGTLALIAVLPVTWPYIAERLAMPGYRRTLGQAALYSADLLDYVRSNPWIHETRHLGLMSGPQSYWPGLIAIMLGIVGVVAVRRMRTPLAKVPLSLTAIGFILSLGPIPHIGGRAFMIPLPYALLYFIVPGFASMRAPARFAVLVALAVVVLAGVGYSKLEIRIARRATRAAVAVALALGAFALGLFRPITLLELPTRNTMPLIYRAVAAQPRNWPLLEIPVPATDADEGDTHALRQLLLLYHGHPRLDGTSGFVSPRYKEFRRRIQAFPADSALDAASRMGATLVLVHYGDYGPLQAGFLDDRVGESRRLQLVAREGTDRLYILRP